LSRSIAGAEKITNVMVTEANVDKGYRGHGYKGAAVIRIAGTSNAKLSASERKRKRRRSAIGPVIGHLKSDHRLDRCFLLGRIGDAINLIGSAAGFNVRKLLRLLGRGIFSHALPTLARFVRATCRLVSATMKYGNRSRKNVRKLIFFCFLENVILVVHGTRISAPT